MAVMATRPAGQVDPGDSFAAGALVRPEKTRIATALAASLQALPHYA